MKYVFPSLLEVALVMRRYPSLVLVFILLHFVPLLADMFKAPFVVNLLLMFVSLGWYAAGFYFINRALMEKILKWRRLPKLIFYYGMKLLPILLAFVVVTVLPFITLALIYGRWYAANYLASGLGLTTQEVIVNFLSALFNPYLWQEFFAQNWFMNLLYQLYQIAVIIGLIWAKMTGILLVVEKYSVVESVVRGLYYLQEQQALILSYMGIRILGNLLVSLWIVALGWLGLEAGLVQSLLVGVAVAKVALAMDIYLLAYYSKTDKRNFLSRGLMRWWRSRGSKP